MRPTLAHCFTLAYWIEVPRRRRHLAHVSRKLGYAIDFAGNAYAFMAQLNAGGLDLLYSYLGGSGQ
jgi:hypothetical protein